MSQRRSHTCADCARRKIKCDKVIPCNNCTKRGTAHLCRRADEVPTSERSQSSVPWPSSIAENQVPLGKVDTSVNEKILALVNTLSDRVQDLEASIRRLEPRKRVASDETECPTTKRIRRTESEAISEESSLVHPKKYGNQKESSRANHSGDSGVEHDSSSGQNDSDAEIEDAATVLEFLAWGRLKDRNITRGLLEVPSIPENSLYDEQDPSHSRGWDKTPSVINIPGNSDANSSQILHIQGFLPSKAQVILLCEYHANWLLFHHCSYHVTTFNGELDHFYTQENGTISMTNGRLQWAALLFAIICGSITGARSSTVVSWDFTEGEQATRAHQWYQAAIDCLNIAKYQQNHSMYSVQAISTLTTSAHILGYSNSQSVMLAASVRISQSLNLHRISHEKKDTEQLDGKGLAEAIQRETGRRVWQQLVIQDWFSVPFSETYCVGRSHFTTKQPLHCDDETLQRLLPSMPAITSYGNFLFHVASLMPELLDKTSEAQTINTKYEQVLKFDQKMRRLVMNNLPPCINGQLPMDSSWPMWVPLARRSLTVTAAHKIIMIHRKFLGLSFHDPGFSFTRRTCLAAAKTIINEIKQEASSHGPVLWTFHAFSISASIILVLDNFNRQQSSPEYSENRQLVSDTIQILSGHIKVSAIAARGFRLLTDLLSEEENFHRHSAGHKASRQATRWDSNPQNDFANSDEVLNVSAFVKRFCETERPHHGTLPLDTQVPLWLQDNTFQSHNNNQQNYNDFNGKTDYRGHPNSSSLQYSGCIPQHQPPMQSTRQQDITTDPFGNGYTDTFDIRSLNWFDELLGLAPSNSL